MKTRERAIADYARYRQAAKAPGDRDAALTAYSTMYRDRGLSSDTKLTADYALDKALEAIAAKGGLAPQSVRRVALVGPGLEGGNYRILKGNHELPPEGGSYRNLRGGGLPRSDSVASDL